MENTEQQHEQDALHQLQQKVAELERRIEQLLPYQQFFEAMPLPAAIFRPDGLNVVANRQNEILLNISRTSIEGCYNILDDSEAQEKGFAGHFLHALRGEVSQMMPTSYNIVQAGFAGQPANPVFWTETTYIPLYNEDGDVAYVGELCLDITRRREMEESLRVASMEQERRVKERTRELAWANQALEREVAERKQTEAALKESEQRYRAMFEKNRAVKLLLDPHTGRIAGANQAASEFYGYPHETLETMHITDINLLLPEEVKRIMHQVLHEERHHMEFQHRLASGEVREVEVYSAPIEANGQMLLYSVIHDVTERKHTEALLRQSEAQFRAFFEQAPIGIGISRSGETLMVNPAYRQMFGYDDDAHDVLDGTPITMCIAPQDRQHVMERARRRFLGESVETQFSFHGLRKDGTTFPLLCTVSRVELTDGVPASVAFFTDITQEKEAEHALLQARDELEQRVRERTAELQEANHILHEEIAERTRVEEALREREQTLQDILELSPDMISNTRIDGQIVWVSPSAEEILGYTMDDYMTIPWNERIHPDDLSFAEELFRTIVEHPAEVAQRRYRVRHANNHWVVLESRARMKTDAAGQPQNVVAVSRDVTAQVELEQRLRQAHAEAEQAMRHKDAFLASVSHELRTPLNAILGLSESLQEEVYGPLNEKQLATLATIERSGRHLLSLINDILDLAKIETGRLSLLVAPVSVESVCQASVQLVRQQAHKKHITLSVSVANDLPRLEADERRLKQVLVNLLANAVKFTPDGGAVGLEVTVCPACPEDTERTERTDQEGESLCFVVWDTGIGISDEQQQNLFKPFVQLDNSLSRQYEGTGLGLSLVARLVALHGGHVTVESEEGKGSRFVVALPCRSGK